MQATLQTIRQIAEDAASDTGAFEIAGVIPTEGGLYVEILLRIKGCEVEPCRFSLGVLREMAPDEMQRLIRDELQRHFAIHAASSPNHV